MFSPVNSGGKASSGDSLRTGQQPAVRGASEKARGLISVKLINLHPPRSLTGNAKERPVALSDDFKESQSSEEDAAMASKQTKNQKRRAALKARKQADRDASVAPTESTLKPDDPEDNGETKADPQPQTNGRANGASADDGTTQDTDYMSFDLPKDNPLYEQFKDVMARFADPDKESPAAKDADKGEVFFDADDDIPDEEDEKEPKLSKKKRKEQSKLSIAELKAVVRKPDLVEWTDVSASDPRLLVSLKSYRNVVPVPSHWSLKREYLSSKRGIEKAPFALPKFIQETGIAEMRDAVLEKQNEATLKQKQRERVNPKMGKLDIDYQRLYEAFFRFQTKPELTRFGEVYYEGKEYETDHKHLKPGDLSDELKEALNIPPGAPPPWLINMQRFGPPPTYPNLKIPGLNAPPPPGGQWGYHPGGYGKPPVDEYNRPLYGGDIFGVLQQQQAQHQGEAVEKTLWGELEEPEEESEEEESEEEEEDEDEDDIGAGLQTPSGMETPGGVASTVPSEYGGSESVGGEFTLRKQRYGTETEEPREPRSAYQVLPEHNVRSQGFMGSDRGYDLSGARNQNIPQLDQIDNRRKRKAGDVDVSVDVDALERDDRLSKDEVRKQFDQQRQAEQQQRGWGSKADQEDLNEMIATESRKRLKKDEERRGRR